MCEGWLATAARGDNLNLLPDPQFNSAAVTIVIAMNSDKKVNGEQGINVLLRDISKILFPNNPVNVPVIK